MERTRTTHRSRRRAAALLAAVGLVVSACGSDTTTANAPAGAKENAVGDAVCYDWPAGTVAKPCAIDLKGPGGGRIFHDAGTTQPWGRFLEVAPQKWNDGILAECPGSGMIGSTCDTADEAKWPKLTGDWGPAQDGLRDRPGEGFLACSSDSRYANNEEVYLSAAARNLSKDIGAGRENTRVLLSDPACTTATGKPATAFQKAANYRGGGLSDWYVPSEEELSKLFADGSPNDIGGFPRAKLLGDASSYVSSSTEDDYAGSKTFFRVSALMKTVDEGNWQAVLGTTSRGVRPIRAF
jgi:hypothetical protein